MDSSINRMDKLDISATFRRQVHKVIGSIVMFMIVYLLLVAAAIGLAFVCGWLGVFIMTGLHNILALAFGLGLMGLGISVIVFLIKFIFAVSKDENPQRVLITEEAQPRLFGFIRKLAKETQTAFPKNIYLSPEVNAAVFYNSSFWSMFLPIRKNLNIGLGLVNSVNISEFKAVMAHEFGHFSQRSMRLGSFTYNVNRVIHNMLYDNRGYSNFLSTWGRLHGAMTLFARAAAYIAGGIQWLLRGMYTFINRNYMGLSREMEFHADAVAAGAAGANNLVSALSRIEIATGCYKTALAEADQRVKQNSVSRNIFSNQLTILRSVAEEYKPSRSRINFQNQWASHPTLQERKTQLEKLQLERAADPTGAWSLFDKAESLQETMTANLYRSLKFDSPTTFYENREFEDQYRAMKAGYALPAAYRGFYDGRYVETKDWDLEMLSSEPVPALAFGQLFNETNGQLQSDINNNKRDVETAKAIGEEKIAVKSFDFDGVKYAAGAAKTVALQLEEEIDAQEQRQKTLDKEAFRYFLHRSGPSRQQLLTNYSRWKQLNGRYEEYVQTVNRLLKRMRPLYAGGLGLVEVQDAISALKEKEEAELKGQYRLLAGSEFLSEELGRKVESFAWKNYAYFVDRQFRTAELEELKGLAIEVANVFNQSQFRWYKKMLVEQLEGIPEELPEGTRPPEAQPGNLSEIR